MLFNNDIQVFAGVYDSLLINCVQCDMRENSLFVVVCYAKKSH